MPALTPEQRRKQIEMQRQREAAAKAANKPKRGQKGVQTSGGSKTKADTIGGAKTAAKPAAKKSTYKVADYSDAQGNVYDGNSGRLKSAAKPKPSPKPSTSPAKAPAPAARSSAPKPAEKVPSSASKTSSSNVGPVASGDEYARNKDPKKYNPLMQKTFGYQKGDSPKERAQREDLERAKSDANKAQIKQGPADPAAKPNSITAAVKKQNEERKQRRRNQMM
jgi:hypothetical protein